MCDVRSWSCSTDSQSKGRFVSTASKSESDPNTESDRNRGDSLERPAEDGDVLKTHQALRSLRKHLEIQMFSITDPPPKRDLCST